MDPSPDGAVVPGTAASDEVRRREARRRRILAEGQDRLRRITGDPQPPTEPPVRVPAEASPMGVPSVGTATADEAPAAAIAAADNAAPLSVALAPTSDRPRPQPQPQPKPQKASGGERKWAARQRGVDSAARGLAMAAGLALGLLLAADTRAGAGRLHAGAVWLALVACALCALFDWAAALAGGGGGALMALLSAALLLPALLRCASLFLFAAVLPALLARVT